jgi:arylsulfatase
VKCLALAAPCESFAEIQDSKECRSVSLRPRLNIASALCAAIASLSVLAAAAPTHAGEQKPNFLLIVADDLGWTDIAPFGGEIKTANIDELAEQGVKFTDFHVSVSCSPTRSMLLTGTDNHIAGLGTMSELLTDELRERPGYEGHLNDRVVTLAEVLSEGGYHTYMAGKWHLGEEPEHFPAARGFKNSFSMLYGGASYYSDMTGVLAVEQEVAKYVRDDQELSSLPDDFFATRSYTDTLMNMIRENREDEQPFFAYLAFTAPHDPVQVHEPWRSMYEGEYSDGFAALKSRRADGAKRAGVFPKNAKPASLHPLAENWNSFDDEQKAFNSKAMEVYAGMVSNMDYQIGRIIAFLKDIDAYDNTIVIFMSDNGSNPLNNKDYSPGKEGERFLSQFDNSTANLGAPNSHYAYGPGWGSACSGPLDQFKMAAGEGGIRSPMIISGPGIKGNRQVDAFAYVTDVMPTMLEIAGIEHPESYKGREVAPMRGRSMTGLLTGDSDELYDADDAVAGELGGNQWVRLGDYKAVKSPRPFSTGEWLMFDLSKDPGETEDLSEQKPEEMTKLMAAWDEYVKEVGVVEVQGAIAR